MMKYSAVRTRRGQASAPFEQTAASQRKNDVETATEKKCIRINAILDKLFEEAETLVARSHARGLSGIPNTRHMVAASVTRRRYGASLREIRAVSQEKIQSRRLGRSWSSLPLLKS